MKGLFRFVKLTIVNRDYARLLCLVSIILYVISLPMHTGIGFETGTEDLPGYSCLIMGVVCFPLMLLMFPLYFVLWISNLIFIYSVYQLWKKKVSERTLALITVSFILTIIYVFYHRLSWEHDYRNYACYVWSLSYMFALWASVLEWAKGEGATLGKMVVHVVFCAIGIGILVLLYSERKYYRELYGERIRPDVDGYRINNKGVFHTYDTELMTESYIDYLKGANADSMVVLSKEFAKDDRHVWCHSERVRGVDVASFTVSKTGVPKDKDHVYWRCLFERERTSRYVPVSHYIDVATAEYFIEEDNKYYLGEYDEDWLRDSCHVFYNGCMLRGIDAGSFKKIGNNKYEDKNGTYTTGELYKLRVTDEEVTE